MDESTTIDIEIHILINFNDTLGIKFIKLSFPWQMFTVTLVQFHHIHVQHAQMTDAHTQNVNVTLIMTQSNTWIEEKK